MNKNAGEPAAQAARIPGENANPLLNRQASNEGLPQLFIQFVAFERERIPDFR